MALQYDDTVANARLDAFETAVGASPTLEMRTGAAPANCAAADSGTLCATLALPPDFMAAAASRSKAKSGTWENTASGNGTVAHFRIKASGGACRMQGMVTATGGGGDMTVQNTNFASGQTFTITGFTLTEAGA